MSFTFGFGGQAAEENSKGESHSEHDLKPPTSHSLDDLLLNLPSQIAWNALQIESPKGNSLLVPRRELFDVRVQLMAEANMDQSKDLIEGLDGNDLKPNVYEGGFKTWECAIDLAKLLLDRGPRKDLDDLVRVNSVIELGCGSAIPSLVLFQYALKEELPIYFTFTDFNETVLELVTLPNLLLTYATVKQPELFGDISKNAHGVLEITSELQTCFLQDLKALGINLTFISGSWETLEPFLAFVPIAKDVNTLVLASETVYSLEAQKSFAKILTAILKQVRLGKGLVAAKKMYFGVGGSTDGFKITCSFLHAVAADVENHGINLGEGGVQRALLEVQML